VFEMKNLLSQANEVFRDLRFWNVVNDEEEDVLLVLAKVGELPHQGPWDAHRLFPCVKLNVSVTKLL